VTQCRVYGMASATPITDQSTLPLIAAPTKSPFQLTLPAAAEGMKFYVCAQWATRKDELGPFGPIVNFTVSNSG